MLTPEEQMKILKDAIVKDYKGPVFKLIDEANTQKGQTATEETKEQGLRGSDGKTAMTFPESKGEFNTEGMDFALDIRKYDKEGNLVKSYNKVPPGIKSLNMGEEEGTVVETPSQYQTGGVRKYQKAGTKLGSAVGSVSNTNDNTITNEERDEFIKYYLESEEAKKNKTNTNTNTSNTSKNKGILSNTVSTTQGSHYYNANGSPMNYEEKNNKISENKAATKTHVKKAGDDITEFFSDPINVADGIGMTGIPVVSEVADLVSAGISTARGNYGDASLSMAGIAIPFAGGAALKQVKNLAKVAPDHSLYRVVDASGNVEAAKFGSSIPPSNTVGRRSGIQGQIQSNTDFDHISATTDQKWLTEGESNLFDRYGGDNPHVVKIDGHEGKIHKVSGTASSAELAKIRPGSYTDMQVAGPQHQNITSILGPKGSKVANVKGVMSKDEYMKALNADPNFKFKKGGYRKKLQTGGDKDGKFSLSTCSEGSIGIGRGRRSSCSGGNIKTLSMYGNAGIDYEKLSQTGFKGGIHAGAGLQKVLNRNTGMYGSLGVRGGLDVNATTGDNQNVDTNKTLSLTGATGFMGDGDTKVQGGIYGGLGLNKNTGNTIGAYGSYGVLSAKVGYNSQTGPEASIGLGLNIRQKGGFNKGQYAGSRMGDIFGGEKDTIEDKGNKETAPKRKSVTKSPRLPMKSLPVKAKEEEKLMKSIPLELGKSDYFTIDRVGQGTHTYPTGDDGEPLIRLKDKAGRVIFKGSQKEYTKKYGEHLSRGNSETQVGNKKNRFYRRSTVEESRKKYKDYFVEANTVLKKTGGVRGHQEGGFNANTLNYTPYNPLEEQLDKQFPLRNTPFPQGRIEKGAPWEVKKGVRAVESANGTLMKNPTSSATGFYGQLYNEIKHMPEMKGVNRDSFASDTTLQNKIFDMRWKGDIPDVPGLNANVKSLKKEYGEHTSEYNDNEIAVISNYIGKQGSREYYASIRDGKEYTPPGTNKSVSQYIKEYRKGLEIKKRGGYRSLKNR